MFDFLKNLCPRTCALFQIKDAAVVAARAAFETGPWGKLTGPGRRDLMLKVDLAI